MPISENGAIQYSLPDQFHTGLTIRGLFELWLPSLRRSVSPASYKTYERIIRCHILPVLGESEVDYLTTADINDFLKRKMENGRLDERGGLSRKSVDDISRILRSVLKLVNWDRSVVQSKQKFVQSSHDRNEVEVLTDAQVRELVCYLVYNIDRSNAGFLLCLFTGIKLSEICALRDSDFDLENNKLRIRRTLQRVTMQEAPKSPSDNQDTADYDSDDNGFRDLDMPDELSAVLHKILSRSEPGAYFLSGASDAAISPRAYQYRFQRVLSDCGLPMTINFHMLRHTFALMWFVKNGDIDALSSALGHASVKVTQKHYLKLFQPPQTQLYLQAYANLLVSLYPGIWSY